MLDSKGILFGIAMLLFGIVIGWFIGLDPQPAQAINVVGAEAITTDKDNATFRVFKTSDETLETDATTVNAKLKGGDKGDALKIAEQASADLQFLANFHQSLAAIDAAFPCPSLAEWEAAEGTSTTSPPGGEFSDCDPDVLYDPGRCTLFWEDIDDKVTFRDDPRETLTGRNVIITVFWDGTIYNISLADPSSTPAHFPDNC